MKPSRLVGFIVAFILVMSASLSAQPAQSAIAREWTGAGVPATSLADAADVIARAPASGSRDSIWNGLLIGAGIGAVYGLKFAPTQFCGGNDPECAAIVRVAIGIPSIAGGAAIGAVIDYFIRRDDSPSHAHGWRKVQVAPLAGKGVRGVLGRVTF